MKSSADSIENSYPGNTTVGSDHEPSSGKKKRPVNHSTGSLPSLSFLLLALAVIVAGTGAATYGARPARPAHRLDRDSNARPAGRARHWSLIEPRHLHTGSKIACD